MGDPKRDYFQNNKITNSLAFWFSEKSKKSQYYTNKRRKYGVHFNTPNKGNIGQINRLHLQS